MSQAEPVLVMSQHFGSAWLKMAQLSWLSQFEPSCGNTNFTIHSPHPSAGLTPVLVPETLSACSGENMSQGATSQSASPSQERQSQS
jgi:hypothetical protein